MCEFNVKEEIFNFIYVAAVRDAVLQKAYIGERTWIKDAEEAKEAVHRYIDMILNNRFADQVGHDRVYKQTARVVCDAINKNKKAANSDFSFGNAQKLINITAKYFYGQCYINQNLRDHFQYCHCPMDSIMLNTVWKNYSEMCGSGKERTKVLNEGLDTDREGDFLKSWGKEDWENEEIPRRYENFQKAVRELSKVQDLYPIEYDYFIWGK